MSFRHQFEQYLTQTAWMKRGVWAWAVRDVSYAFGWLVQRRKAAFASGARMSHTLNVPVVVVGNIISGGAGKTPVVLALIAHLQAKGWQVGAISRGYGGSHTTPQGVNAQSRPQDVGDEPLLIARTGCPIWVGRDRVACAKALLAAHPHTQVIVSDDGLQHWALARSVEVLVFDERGVGNGWPLPAGPMREAWPRTPMATQLVVRHGAFPQGDAASGVFDAARRLAGHAIQANGSIISLAELALNSQSQQLHALAAIAKPQAFFDMLRSTGLQLARTTSLPDHYHFDSNKVNEIAGKGRKLPENSEPITVCTEKDAVKLWAHMPQAWAVPLEVSLGPEFWAALDHTLGEAPSAQPTDSAANGSI